MKGALIILLVTVIAGLILYLLDRRHKTTSQVGLASDLSDESDGSDKSDKSDKSENSEDSECCGLHLVCEKEMEAIVNDKTLYYDDEELDRYAGRGPEEYNEVETEEFRDVLMTLLPQDVPGWARSLDRRNIRPPQEIRDELLILLRDLAG